ncbi:hypothetical protein HN51_032774 [Arachis hypogaea]|uniref:Glutaredoxin domain-containing protein n=2 Tax=Arachis hypogaea TaxID=3818 RepID=A0A445B355_ARAHY|nr:uncharacterized protein At5g39865 [Arachis hypogaea]QHO17144.1 uncharacterized protein DS421_10g309680 [Arachis hypogaea]RYR33125.1 hypothetical protein Ahy_A10g047695 isoform B [Arachis hypogaea]
MGCASSKQKEKRCIHCNSCAYSERMPRSYSMHVHHPPQRKGDSYHVVALTSTTLGSLDHLSTKISASSGAANGFRFTNENESENEKEKEVLISNAKTWSNMIEEKLPKVVMMPKTPITTPPCDEEPETINTWELMEGLEDTTTTTTTTSPLMRSPNHHFVRSFSFDVNVNRDHLDPNPPNNKSCCFIENNHGNDESKKGGEPYLIKNGVSECNGFSYDEEKKKICDDDDDDFKHTPFGKKEKVVFYFTSLRGVRKTYEDCCHVRLILKGLGVKMDERDVSMHSGFKEELKELLRAGGAFGKGGGLPRVFVGGNYIGGAEEIQRMHEEGKLEKLLQCCQKIDENNNVDGGGVCEACGDIRFVPCETCYGSCKIYYDEGYDDDDDDDEEEQREQDSDEVGDCGFKRCPDCNENGLIRCPICCY